MKIYKSPRTKSWEKHEEERKLKKIKKNTPKPIRYTTSEGEKIKYIPCDVDYEIEVEKKSGLWVEGRRNMERLPHIEKDDIEPYYKIKKDDDS